MASNLNDASVDDASSVPVSGGKAPEVIAAGERGHEEATEARKSRWRSERVFVGKLQLTGGSTGQAWSALLFLRGHGYAEPLAPDLLRLFVP